MTSQTLEELKYPIGQFEPPEVVDRPLLDQWINDIEALPTQLEKLVIGLSDEQLDTPYRPGGWSIRQVIHHLPDSHTNSYIRFKWALTENKPLIKAYNEDAWANLFDSAHGPIDLSMNYLKALHTKWVHLLKGLDDQQLKRSFIHPDSKDEVSLDVNIGIYAWHGKHHYMHIRNLMIRSGWV